MPDLSFVWVDRDGGEVSVPLPAGTYAQPRLSPDGTKLAVAVFSLDQGSGGQYLLWVYDVATGAALRLTNEATAQVPVWTPDSRRIVFAWNVGGAAFELYSVPADGSGAPEALSPDNAPDTGGLGDFPSGMTPDGRTVIFSRSPSVDRQEVWEIDLTGDRTARPIIEGTFTRGNAEVSPDGNWLAYRSNQSGLGDRPDR